jgi:hypothetical protein
MCHDIKPGKKIDSQLLIEIYAEGGTLLYDRLGLN